MFEFGSDGELLDVAFDSESDDDSASTPRGTKERDHPGGSHAADDEVAAAAARYPSGNSVAQQVYGDGGLRVGTGPLALDWTSCVARLLAAPPSEKLRLARALGTFAQVQAHSDAMREAGAIDAAAALLRHGASEELEVAAAEVIRHLACANQRNRDAARAAGAIAPLVRMLRAAAAEAAAAEADLSDGGGAAVAAAAAALRNLSFHNGANRALIRSLDGLAPLLRIVACGAAGAGARRREAAYRAAGALENLAADDAENAAAIVEAGVVPAMKELLIGRGHADLSHKAARKQREALYRLVMMDRKLCAQRAVAEGAVDGESIRAVVRRKMLVLAELRGAAEVAVEEVVLRGTLAVVEMELRALARDAEWAHAVVSFTYALHHGASHQCNGMPDGAPAVS
ncbi:hypothetical protein AB1Y20_008204 [Prymnesium parvum]|uniref:Protein HGH1 homolog n=1 Tax=Prymnesium parvum TaxID=97485 RepID=A0AB34IVS7_PRYPA